MKHASEMTMDEIWAKGRRAQEFGLGNGGLGSGYAARLGTMERAVREMKEYQAKLEAMLKRLRIDATDDATDGWVTTSCGMGERHEKYGFEALSHGRGCFDELRKRRASFEAKEATDE